MLSIDDKIRKFLEEPEFAVVGASWNPQSWSNKLLLWYEARKLTVYPVNPNRKEVDGDRCLKCIADLPSPTTTALSIVTRSSTTLSILQQAQKADSPMMWIQPGADDDTVLDFINKHGMEDKVIWSMPQTSAIDADDKENTLSALEYNPLTHQLSLGKGPGCDSIVENAILKHLPNRAKNIVRKHMNKAGDGDGKNTKDADEPGDEDDAETCIFRRATTKLKEIRDKS